MTDKPYHVSSLVELRKHQIRKIPFTTKWVWYCVNCRNWYGPLLSQDSCFALLARHVKNHCQGLKAPVEVLANKGRTVL